MTAASKNKSYKNKSITHQVRTRGEVRKLTIKTSSQPTVIFAPIPLWSRMEAKPVRVILLGKTGAGKSSFGNALIGENVFKVGGPASSGASECKPATKKNGTITVIDTPGFIDTGMSDDDEMTLKPEIIKSMIECSPGLHAFLILLKVERYTKHEKEVITEIKEAFSEEVFKYAVLVFTHGDQLDEGKSIKDFVSENEALQELSDKRGGCCHVVDNKYWNNNQEDPYRNNQVKIRELLKTIDEMVKQNGGGCYTNEMLQAVYSKIKAEEERTGSREEGKKKVFNNISKRTADTGKQTLLGALLGQSTMDKLFISAVFGVTAAGAGAAIGAGVGAVVGGPVGAAIGGKAGAVVGAVAAAATIRGVTLTGEENVEKQKDE